MVCLARALEKWSNLQYQPSNPVPGGPTSASCPSLLAGSVGLAGQRPKQKYKLNLPTQAPLEVLLRVRFLRGWLEDLLV